MTGQGDENFVSENAPRKRNPIIFQNTTNSTELIENFENSGENLDSDNANFIKRKISFDDILSSTPYGWYHVFLFVFCSATWYFYAFVIFIFIKILKKFLEMTIKKWNFSCRNSDSSHSNKRMEFESPAGSFCLSSKQLSNLLIIHKNLQGGLLGASVYFGMLIGAAGGGILADRFGRKPIFVIGFFWVAFFGGMTALAPEFWSFFFMRAFSGIGLGAATPISVTWLLEFGDFKARGSISGAMHLFYAFGRFGSTGCAWLFVILPNFGWRWLIFFINFIGISAAIVGIFIPESPRWLFTQGRVLEALASVSTIRTMNFCPPVAFNPEVDEIIPFSEKEYSEEEPIAHTERDSKEFGDVMESLIEDSKSEKKTISVSGDSLHKIPEKKKKLSFVDRVVYYLLGDEFATTSLLLWAMWFLDAFGAQGFYYLTPQLLQKIYPENPYILMMTITGVGFLGYISATLFSEFMPRKFWLCFVFIGMGSSLVLLAAIPQDVFEFLFPANGRFFYIVYIVFFGSIAAPFNGFAISMMYVYATEVYPTVCRSTGMGICTSIHRLGAVVTPLIAQEMFATNSFFLPYCAFGCAMISVGIHSIFLPYETRNTKLKDGISE